MSELKVNSIVDASSGNTVQINGQTPSESNMQGRNRIINGDMRIDQRNAGAAVTAGPIAFSVDRFFATNSATGTYSAQQDASVPAGFNKSVKITVTAAQTAGTGNLSLTQNIEGNNIADLGWGTANAQEVTLSFWVRSSLTGTFGGAIRNKAANRSYPFTYVISVADTWEYKTVSLEGDTTGTWDVDNSLGLMLRFSLFAPTGSQQTDGAWFAGSATGATGQVQLGSTNGATWQITGVQLEAGSVATPFERRPFGAELALCQRYYWKNAPLTAATDSGLGNGFQTSTTASSITVFYPVTMRALPSATQTNLIVSDNTAYDADVSAIGNIVSTLSSAYLGIAHASAGATYRPCNLRSKASGGIGFIDFSAEL